MSPVESHGYDEAACGMEREGGCWRGRGGGGKALVVVGGQLRNEDSERQCAAGCDWVGGGGSPAGVAVWRCPRAAERAGVGSFRRPPPRPPQGTKVSARLAPNRHRI